MSNSIIDQLKQQLIIAQQREDRIRGDLAKHELDKNLIVDKQVEARKVVDDIKEILDRMGVGR